MVIEGRRDEGSLRLLPGLVASAFVPRMSNLIHGIIKQLLAWSLIGSRIEG